MLIEFSRVVEREDEDGLPEIHNPPIAINARCVGAVFGCEDDGADVTIIRLTDGRGLKVKGTYAEILAKLSGANQGG
jgi:hypothetical protein